MKHHFFLFFLLVATSLSAQDTIPASIAIIDFFPQPPNDEPLTIYHPFKNDRQLVEINYHDHWQQEVDFMERTQPRGMAWAAVIPYRGPNVYIVRGRNGNIIKTYNDFGRGVFKDSLEPPGFVSDGLYHVHSQYGNGRFRVYDCKGLDSGFDFRRGSLPCKTGLIDLAGNIILPMKYDNIYMTNKGYFVFKGEKYGMLNKDLKPITPVKYEGRYLQSHLDDKVFIVEENGKQKIVSQDGEEKTRKGFDKIDPVQNRGMEYYYIMDEGKRGIMGKNLELIIPPNHEALYLTNYENQKYFLAQKKEKYGLYYTDGSIALPFKYGFLKAFKDFIQIKTKEGHGIIRPDLSELIPPGFDTLVVYNNIRCLKDGYWTFYTPEGERISEVEYEHTIKWYYGYYIVSKDGKYGLLNERVENGVLFIPAIYDELQPLYPDFENNLRYNAVRIGKYWGLLESVSGEMAVPIQYEEIFQQTSGKRKIYIKNKAGKWAEFKKKGKVLNFNLDRARH